MTPAVHPKPEIFPETSAHAPLIDAMHNRIFGRAMFARAAHVVRQGTTPDPRFSYVVVINGELIGSVRLTNIVVGKGEGFLLGPLCVEPKFQGEGAGKALVRRAVQDVQVTDAKPVFLVGDRPYYGPLGFSQAPKGVKMPASVDYNRVLVHWSNSGENRADYSGIMRGIGG